jgi:hypothetical protein
MTPDGEFRMPPRPPLLKRILVWALLVAVIAGSFAMAAVALWLALIILPIAILAALLAWGIYRYQVWRNGVSGGAGSRGVFRDGGRRDVR